VPRTVFRLCVSFLLFASVTQPQTLTRVPVYRINRAASSIKFAVNASVAIAGTFDHWDAALAFTSLDPATGVLDVKIQAASVDTGSGMKNGKLRAAISSMPSRIRSSRFAPADLLGPV
jgi:polyisoprenoid-binding protein YceI